MASSITAKDVALHADVSVGTVSRVFNNHSNVSEDIRQRVLKVAADLGYFRGSLTPARPESRILKEVGFLYASSIEDTPATVDPYWTPIFHGVESESRKFNIKITYRTITDIQHSPHLLATTLYEMRLGGVLLVGQFDAEAISAIQATRTPLVLVDEYVADLAQPVDTILPNNFQGARMAMDALFQAGHRQIAFIGGPVAPGPRPTYKIYSVEQRWISYCMTFLDRALSIPYDLVEHGNLTLDGGYAACKRLLERKAGSFSAIFCVDDITAIGAMKALREAGYNIPEDISLIGFDGINLGEHITPALSTIHIDTPAMGAVALKTLVARATDPDTPCVTTLLAAKLLLRNTIASPRS